MSLNQSLLQPLTALPQQAMVSPAVAMSPAVTLSSGGLTTPRPVSNSTPSTGVIVPQMNHRIANTDFDSITKANTFQLPAVFSLSITNTGSTSPLTVAFFNNDILKAQDSHCVYNWSTPYGSNLISAFLYMSRASVGACIYKIDYSAYLNGAADSVGANNVNFTWEDADAFGNFRPYVIPSQNISRSDFSDQTFSIKMSKNVARFTQGNVTFTSGTGATISMIFYTNPS